jgi:hypothetical protein
MLQEDLKEITELLEKNGYEFNSLNNSNDGYADLPVVGAIFKVKKNIWEGVKYAKCKDNSGHPGLLKNGKIYKVEFAKGFQEPTLTVLTNTIRPVHTWLNAERFIPATEAAYKLQLIAEAKERFGEIKNGDRFDCSNIGCTKNGVISLGLGWILDHAEYDESKDELSLLSFVLYRQGKWVEKIWKEDIKYVQYLGPTKPHGDKDLICGRLYKGEVDTKTNTVVLTFPNCTNVVLLDYFKPATKEEYLTYLKSKAKELYGGISDKDKFDLSELGLSSDCSISLDYKDTLDDANYMEDCDELRLIGFTLYRKGKWAKRIEDAKVVNRAVDYQLDEKNKETTITMTFKLNQYKRMTNLFQIRLSQYMGKVASEIEKLNKEHNN